MTGNLIMPGGAQAATQSYVNTAISNLVNAAPTALDTLKELATALNNDASFATTVTNSIASKLALSGGTLTGQLSGTNARFFGSQAYYAEVSADSAGGFIQAYNASTLKYQPYLIYGGSNTTGFSLITVNNSGTSFSGSVAIGTSSAPGFPLDLVTSTVGTFNTIAQFQNTDYTANNRAFIRVRQWASAGGSYSSYFGTGQDGNLYVIANNSARGGDLIINAGNGYLGLGTNNPVSKLDINGGNIRLGEYLNSASSLIGKQRSATGVFYSSIEFYSTTSEDVIIFNTHLSGVSAGERVRITGSGNMGVGDVSPSQKLTVAGSIKMNQDAALRAGSSDNWIIGQDSGTNIIHLGSASVANDIRFDSSNQAGNVIIKSNGRLGINTIDPATTFDVNGAMGLRGGNYFYFGHTTSNIGGWTTRTQMVLHMCLMQMVLLLLMKDMVQLHG
jgi:hypothetical protein